MAGSPRPRPPPSARSTGALAVLHGGLRLPGLMECLRGTAVTSGMIFLILLGAETFNAFLAQTQNAVLLPMRSSNRA